MRMLLAAMTCPSGDVGANVRSHATILELAAERRCDIAVFPEMSLTGSIDPHTAPERTVSADAATVEAVAAATHRTGVGAVFGIAERTGDRFHISQIYAHRGRVAGIYRKRHLGEGEEGFTPGTKPATFNLGAVRFGVAICAESGVEFPWRDAADAGASVVFFPAAPGLYGRRTDEESWRQGFAWWQGAGLGYAVKRARDLSVWVAMTTQAGSTADEDFPGIAALVSPGGDVVERLPDWRPGNLVVDIPLDVAVEQVREAVRVLVVDEDDRALLVQFIDGAAGTTWWCPPGGGLEPGEDHILAARREMREELDRTDLRLGPWIGGRTATFSIGERWLTQRERWILCRTPAFDVADDHVAKLAAESVHAMRWWSAQELREHEATTTPRRLPDLLDQLSRGVVPAPDTDLGR